MASSRIVKSDLKQWNFTPREDELYASRKKIPTWRVANQARKYLAGIVGDLMNSIPAPDTSVTATTIEAITARQLASVNQGAIVVGSVSAIMSLVACGHEREAMSHGRTALEALIRARQVADDPSGEVARKLLAGRAPCTLQKAAQRYGNDEEIKLLHRFSHADLLGLMVIATRRPNGIEADLNILPQRGKLGPASQLLIAARTAGEISAVLAEIFGVAVEIPSYLSEQLIHYRNNPLPKGL